MEIIYKQFESLTSTNDWGREHFSTFDPDALTVVLAREQTAGRGQYGKRWIGPKGLNLYASYCFTISESQEDPLTLTHVMALSVIHLLEKCGLSCTIKWPNDVMIEGKKIAGILCETLHLPKQFEVVLGVGLNVNMPQNQLEAIDQPATSLLVETKKQANLEEITHSLSQLFSDNLLCFFKEGFTPFMPRFRQLVLPSS